MLLQTIILKNYFLHSNLKVELKKINFFIGNSCSGKTSLLDGINFLFNGYSFLSSDNQKIIKKNEQIATIEGFFVVDNKRKKTKQKISLHKNKTIFFLDYQTKDFVCNDLFFVSVFFIDQKKSLELPIDKMLLKLHPFFKNKIEQIKLKEQERKKNFSSNLTNTFLENEKKLAILYCEIIDIKKNFLIKLNHQIKHIINQYFLNKISFFSVSFVLNNHSLDQISQTQLWNQVCDFLKKERTIKKTKLFLQLKFSQSLILSENEQRIREFVFNVALLKIIQKESENKTLFLFDNLHFFDFEFQRIILNILQSFDQSIITSCYKDKKVDDSIFLDKKIYQLQKN